MKFGLIECVGVLHHTQDPYLGLKSLVNVLRPGGMIKLGLYSSKAREHIAAIRNEIISANLNINSASIRNFRQNLIKSSADDHTKIRRSSDFYSLSTVRDLLFHIQEHTFSIAQSENYIKSIH